MFEHYGNGSRGIGNRKTGRLRPGVSPPNNAFQVALMVKSVPGPYAAPEVSS